MQRQKTFAAVNIGGFAVGIAACLLMTLYIYTELSYDRQNPHGNNVYRVIGESRLNGQAHSGTSFPAPMSLALATDFPEVEKAGRIMPNALFGGANNQLRRPESVEDNYETGFCFADSSILSILAVPMIYGDAITALLKPNSVVLCKSLSDKYFPNQDPVGKTLVFNDNTTNLIVVGGVMQDFPSTSHLQYRGFISLAGVNFWQGEQQTWDASNYGIYLQLRPGTDARAFEKKMTSVVIEKYVIPALKASGRAKIESSVRDSRIWLQPLADIHLKSYGIDQDDAKKGDIRFIWLFGAIAAFVLLLACINFLNLSTARSAGLAKEVGLRKVIGAGRGGLISQFLAESMLYSFLSFLIGIVIASLSLKAFTQLSGTSMQMPWHSWYFMPALVLAALVIGLLAGIYPAFYLSRFRPVETLKGNAIKGTRNAGLRSSLVVFQFTVSIILIVSTGVVYNQMQFILNSKTGFDKERVVMIEGAQALRSQTAAFTAELRKLPFVQNVSVSDFLPVADTKRNGNTYWPDRTKQSGNGIAAQRWVVDENYLPTLGMKLIAGRNFSKEMSTDSQSVIINKAMADQLGMSDPLGKTIFNGETRTIIGVVDNFYFESVRQSVGPLTLVPGNSNSIISVKMAPTATGAALSQMEQVWKKFIPYQPLRTSFLDQRYATMYADVQRMQYLFTGFAALAVVIACLGLFALAAFMAEKRRKELSIRKVLGASVSSLFALLTGNFLKWVLVSLVIAIPAAWWLMNMWLRDYANRITIGWQVFAVAGICVIVVSLLTVGWQAAKAALVNPVKNLRSE